MKTSYVIAAVVILVLGGVVAWLLLTDGASDFLATERSVTEPDTINELAAAYVDRPYPDDYNVTRVVGYVDNVSQEQFSSVTLEIQLLTSDGDKAELIEHTLEDIAPGTRKTFDINAGTIGDTRLAEGGIAEIVILED